MVAALLAAATAMPAQAASVSATGALSLTVAGPDAATLGVPITISALVTNTTSDPTGSSATVDFFVPLGNQLQGAITNSTGAPACAWAVEPAT